jgi:hypothetical protein
LLLDDPNQGRMIDQASGHQDSGSACATLRGGSRPVAELLQQLAQQGIGLILGQYRNGHGDLKRLLA